MSVTNNPNYSRLMATVRVLDTHYSTLAGMARRQLLDSKIRGDNATAKGFQDALKKLSDDHEKALKLIANKLTEVSQLQATRKALREAADKAHKFVKKLRSVKLTLDKMTEVANFLTGLISDLRRILA